MRKFQQLSEKDKIHLISISVLLRDITTLDYIDKTHKQYTNIIDTIYNMDVVSFKPPYDEIYKSEPLSFWNKIIDYIKSINTPDISVSELITDYHKYTNQK